MNDAKDMKRKVMRKVKMRKVAKPSGGLPREFALKRAKTGGGSTRAC